MKLVLEGGKRISYLRPGSAIVLWKIVRNLFLYSRSEFRKLIFTRPKTHDNKSRREYGTLVCTNPVGVLIQLTFSQQTVKITHQRCPAWRRPVHAMTREQVEACCPFGSRTLFMWSICHSWIDMEAWPASSCMLYCLIPKDLPIQEFLRIPSRSMVPRNNIG
jgi:hypothetical protein